MQAGRRDSDNQDEEDVDRAITPHAPR